MKGGSEIKVLRRRFIFFVTLLSIPEPSFTIAFKIDLDNSGWVYIAIVFAIKDIDRQEFNKVMALMRSQGKQNMEGHKPKVSVEDKGLLEYFFGKDGKRLKLERIVQFFRDLHEEVCDLFSGGDINKLLDRVDEIENDTHLKDIKITYKEFKDFAELHKNLQSFSGSLNSYGEVNRSPPAAVAERKRLNQHSSGVGGGRNGVGGGGLGKQRRVEREVEADERRDSRVRVWAGRRRRSFWERKEWASDVAAVTRLTRWC
ncbi:hypothetical protein C1H46_026055 [Malus baccata]|uniref:Uncharacterized protein n=1 Tax=Malus baccata TaxID=106549 RepID=A0A540LPI2_MALBA|nr:hypothetical protein C1H46_026055 [Malus baccata]